MRMSSGHPNVCCTRPGRCFAGSTSQTSFSPMPNFCGWRPTSRAKRRSRSFVSEPRAPFRDQHIFAHQRHAALIGRSRLAGARHAHVAGRHADHVPVAIGQKLRRREARIDLHAQRLGLRREPAADTAERDDEIAVVAHQRRHEDVRQPRRPRRTEPEEAVVGHRRCGSASPRCRHSGSSGRARSDR